MQFNHKEEILIKALGFEDRGELVKAAKRFFIKQMKDQPTTEKEKTAAIVVAISKEVIKLSFILREITGTKIDSPSKVIEYLFNTLSNDAVFNLLDQNSIEK